MKFTKVRSGEYVVKLSDGMYLLVERKGHREWTWCLCGIDGGIWWETDDNGPHPTLKLAMEDAIANYEDYL
jgi:hypothetical protein